jgi:hypothetical protein
VRRLYRQRHDIRRLAGMAFLYGFFEGFVNAAHIIVSLEAQSATRT